MSLNITEQIRSNQLLDDYIIEVSEVQEFISWVKASTNEELCGLSSDFFLLMVLLSYMFTLLY